MSNSPAESTTTASSRTRTPSPTNSFKSSTTTPTTPKQQQPPPIPIPHLLLDRSRLKPVPRQPKPAPIQTPPAFTIPTLRSKLRSTTNPSPHSNNPSQHKPASNRSVSNQSHNNNTSTTPQKTSTETQADQPAAEPQPAEPAAAEPQPEPPAESLPEPQAAQSQLEPTVESQPQPPAESTPEAQPQPPAEPQAEPPKAEDAQPDPPAETQPGLSPTVDSQQADISLPSPSEDSPDQPQAHKPSPTEPQPMPDHQQDHHQLTNSLPHSENNPDQIQPWQHQFNRILDSDHSSLERANSAAARLNSLAKLNGLKIPDLPDPPLHPSSDTDNSLPPFLMAKHIEETKKKAGLISPTLPIPQYPLPLPVSLGFSVGPNGRGVPRLSALQRKALEKMANQQDSQDLSTATTSLTRSHTTTGTESPKRLPNPIHSPSTDESHQRQQARSNLIRKLSSRGPNTRLKLSPPLVIPSPADLQADPPSIPNPQLSCSSQPIHPESAFDHPEPLPELITTPTLDTIDHQAQEIIPSVDHLALNTTTIDSVTVDLSRTQTPLLEENTMVLNLPPVVTDHSPAVALRYSLNSLDSQTDPKHAIRTAPTNSHNPTSGSETIIGESKPTVAAQSYPSSSPSHSHPVPESSWLDFSETNSKSFISDSPDLNTEPISETTLAPTPDPVASSPSVRSSIVSRLKARASLSSRIDRSTATGRSPSPGQPQSRQSSIDRGSEVPAERRRSTIHGNHRVSRPSNSSTVQRVRPTANETSQDRARQSYTTLASRVGSPSPSHHTDRPLRPTRAPPITQAHNVVGGRSAISRKSSTDLGPSQFPPTPHLVRTHMPVASAVDLARYNDQKLAPFPALLDSSPPGSPERARSPPRSNLKSSKSQGHSILSSASNFFRSPSRSQDENTSRAANQMVSSPPATVMASPPSYPVRMSRSDEEQEEVVEPARWQSMGDAAGKMNAAAEVSRSATIESNTSSTASMISSQRREQILARLSPFLRPSHPTASPDHRLNDPPRKLLWHQPVLQVVNATSVKDRYLFLFNDILVITKPIIEFEDCKGESVPKLPITLKHSFLTKSVVEIKNLRCVCTNQARRSSTLQDKHPIQSVNDEMSTPEHWFQQAFQEDPSRAIQSHLQSIHLEPTDSEIAKLLIATTDLDRRQLGQFLTSPDRTGILRSYLEQMNLAYMRIEDSLRSVLLSLRLPADPPAIERFLEEFGVVWTTSNPKVGLTPALVTRWTTTMIVLSEHLHDGLTDSMRYVAGFIGFPNDIIKTEVGFVESMVQAEEAFKAQGKPSSSIAAEKLETMLKKSFQSIRRDRLVQARASIEDTEKIKIEVEEEGDSRGSKLPSHIIYQIPSELVTIRIPEADPQFGIKLFGSGLSFEPSFLSFSQSSSASFRIKGKALGVRQVSMIKIGRRAAAYDGLPLDLTVSVERAFMKHTVQVGFLNHMMAKRKYLFSFLGPQPKTDFLDLVDDAQAAAKHHQPFPGQNNGPQAVAKTVALQVLIDSLILNEDLVPMNVNPYASTTVGLKVTHHNKSKKKELEEEKKPASSSTSNHQSNGNGKIRSNSLSETYIHTLGSSEKELHQAIIERRNQAQELHIRKRQQKLLKESLVSNLSGGRVNLNPYSCSNKDAPVGLADENQNIVALKRFIFVGSELIHLCQQNSLVPLVLGFLSMGMVDKNRLITSNPSAHAGQNHHHPHHHQANHFAKNGSRHLANPNAVPSGDLVSDGHSNPNGNGNGYHYQQHQHDYHVI
ncbi:uncharacterized protein PGTG_00087 [Puccinia graminis f. sp. tritici CRL 75-36-700-3]|uniref:SEC7 domain-containing protein n=1 Tax=Puccinia graminis f. sp. tritici (strain CRL 75-36-700-3 / race SCCL) TaxID=418459 RepID=E3JQ48_PUCGT|nr:uncharacterized protein PGTG_00087 [Puccinia graminis f. sp. tritici CRL 75-36-700-3]EFP74131.1 hypothetical protein PGTG_00087 [Puccinia graminis f. sp. tritici CRL 75-36-700-3]